MALSTRTFALDTWLTIPPSEALLTGWTPLYTQERPTPQLPKKYFVRLASDRGAPTWSRHDAPLNQSLRHQPFVEKISLYSIAQDQKTLELHLKGITEDQQRKLTQDLVSFCKNPSTPCEVSLQDSPEQVLWLVKIPQ